MSTSMTKQFRDVCNAKDAERQFKLAGSPAIHFIPQVFGEVDMREIFTLDLQLTPYPSKDTFSDNVRTSKTIGDKEEQEADDKTPPLAVEKRTYKQEFRKLCSGTAEDY